MRPNPLSIRLSQQQLDQVDELAELISQSTGEVWTRHRIVKTCSLAGLDAIYGLELSPGGVDADA